MARRTLVVGASGILAPAAEALVARGHEVTGAARRRPVPDGVARLGVDARSADAMRSALGDARWDDAIVYAPAVTDESFAVIEAAVDGTVVLVRVSAAADPALGPLRVPRATLQLGWRDEPDGTARWHTPAEIAPAALAVLEDAAPRILGAVRPWERRP